jgi:hypothetical protein
VWVKSGLNQTDAMSDEPLSGMLLPAKAIAVRTLYQLMFLREEFNQFVWISVFQKQLLN